MGADLIGKRVLVTGASSGIGLATVETFARRGATVALNYLPADPRGVTEILGRFDQEGLQVQAAPGDVSRPGEAEAMVRQAIQGLGGLDYLVNNAGISGTKDRIPNADFDRLTEAFWQAILTTNLIGPFRCAKAAAEALRQSRGAIVNTASVAGLHLAGSSMAYGASKAGLINLTKNLARALAPEVRVNAVAPGFVDTGWTESWQDVLLCPVGLVKERQFQELAGKARATHVEGWIGSNGGPLVISPKPRHAKADSPPAMRVVVGDRDDFRIKAQRAIVRGDHQRPGAKLLQQRAAQPAEPGRVNRDHGGRWHGKGKSPLGRLSAFAAFPTETRPRIRRMGQGSQFNAPQREAERPLTVK